jgi:fermentation-respiration switch protein FrsA (DUF1100 family)
MNYKKLLLWILGVVGLLMLTSCDHHFYQPSQGEFYSPTEFDLNHEAVSFQSSDGETLHGWFFPSDKRPAKGTILHLHGNSANMTNYLYYVAFLVKEGYHLLMFDYRGFGKSSGEPSPGGVLRDSEAALAYLRSRNEVRDDQIIIYGQSLGAAVAISLVGRSDKRGIKAVIAEAPFSAYRRAAQEKMEEVFFLSWFSGLAADISIDDRTSPIRFVRQVSPVPLLIVHGTADRVVPFAHGQRLFDRAIEPKTFWVIEEGRHIQMLSKFRSIYRPKLLAYLASL